MGSKPCNTDGRSMWTSRCFMLKNKTHYPSQTLCLPWISYATQKHMLDSCKMLQKQCEAFPTLFLWHFIAYRPSKVSSRPDCIFEIHLLWHSGFSRVYSNCCCSCSFEREIIKIGQSSPKMYNNNIMNFQASTTILNACTKNVRKPIEGTTYVLTNSINQSYGISNSYYNFKKKVLIERLQWMRRI